MATRYNALRRLSLLALSQTRSSSSCITGPIRTTVPHLHQGAQHLCPLHFSQNLIPQTRLRWLTATPAPEEKVEDREGEEDSGEKQTPVQPDSCAAPAPDSGKDPPTEEGPAKEAPEGGATEFEDLLSDESVEEKEEEKSPSYEALVLEVGQRSLAMEELKKKNEELKDKVLRALAEMENMRERVSRQADQAKKFAVEGFVKDLLDVADNLERALESVPKEELDEAVSKKVLSGLVDGVKITEQQLLKAFRKNNVEKFRPEGDQFDPNKHNAMFQVPGTEENKGLVAAVTKCGYMMHDRVVRPAEVGVYKSQENSSG